uniref:Glucagon / GIP / secretin / VIP family domain-containing protein n=1 Tax=Myripristis murdjan TaxID=586833 RepID=A0A667ZNP4_9TELE
EQHQICLLAFLSFQLIPGCCFVQSRHRYSKSVEKGQNILKNFKRHSDGTFTSDFTNYLDKIKAKDFVEWLASTKRLG